MDNSQNQDLDPAIARLNEALAELIEARDHAGPSLSNVSRLQVLPLLAAVQNPIAWRAWTYDPAGIDALLGELADTADPHGWALAHSSRISRLHPSIVRNLMLTVDSWTPEEDVILEAMDPVWQIAHWMALPNDERAVSPCPLLKRLPTESTQALFALRLDLATASDRAPTLQEVGDLAGVSRERIRQALLRCVELLEPFRPKVERFRRWLRSMGLLLPLGIIKLPDEPRLIWAASTLVNQFGLDIDPIDRTISGYTVEEVDRSLADLVSEARLSRFAAPLVDPTELKAWLSQVHSRRAWPSVGIELVMQRITRTYLKSGSVYSVWRGTSRIEQLEFILSRYPQGFAIHKDSDILVATLAELFGEEGLVGQSLATRAMESPRIHLWGHGLHIHQSFIPPASPLLDEIVEWLEDRLTSDFEEISILAAWNEFDLRCEAAGIPSTAALYTWLRLNASNRLNTPRYPTVLSVGNNQRLARTSIVREYLRAEGPVPFETMADHLSAPRAGSSSATLNTMHTMLDLYRGDDDRFYLTEWLSGRQRIIDLLKPKVEASLTHAPLVSIITLYRRHREFFYSVGIAGPRTLWGVLRDGLTYLFRFGTYPMITHLSGVGEATVRAAIISAVKSHGAPIARPLIEEILIRDYGIQAKSISLTALTDEIILYQGHPANQYIHRDWLGWNVDKQKQLNDRLTTVLSNLRSADPPIGCIEGLLLCPEGLPPLGHNLTWTRELLLEFLRPMENIIVLGTRRRLFVPVENDLGIESDLDLAGYILAQQFGRKAPLTAWEQTLIRLDFCKQVPVGYHQDSAAPFMIIGEEVRLRPHGERWLLPSPRVLVWPGSATVPVGAVSPELVGTPEVDELFAVLFGED